MTLALIVLLALPVTAQEPAERPITLAEAFAAAKTASEPLAAAGAGVEELRRRVRELKGLVSPQAALQGSEFLQDSAGGGGGVQGTFNRRDRPEARVTVSQAVFSGLREFLTIKAAVARGDAARHDLERAVSLLYKDVAAAFLDVLELRRELATREATRALTQERVRELEGRVKLGRSRASELLAAQVQLARLEADLPDVRGREETAQEVLRFLTGFPERLAPAEPELAAPAPLDAALRRARSRADVAARRLERDAALFAARSQRRERWPLVTASGNWWLKRVGFQESIDWDATLTASLPLWTGGALTARVAQADARLGAAEARLRGAERLAESEARRAWARLLAARERSGALAEAVALAERNAKAQSEDYKLGVVTNLDVLGALTQLQEARLDLESARLEAARAAAELEAACGGPGGTQRNL